MRSQRLFAYCSLKIGFDVNCSHVLLMHHSGPDFSDRCDVIKSIDITHTAHA